MALVALVALFSLAVAPTAGAATFNGGTTTVSLGKGFVKQLKAADTTVTAGEPASRVKKKVTLPLTTGEATFDGVGALNHDGTLVFTRGSKTVTLSELVEKLRGTTATLTGKAGGKKVALLNQAAGSRVEAAAGMVGLDATKLPATLTKAAAKKLNKKLGTKAFERGMKVGSVSFAADRAVTFTAGSGVGRQVFSPETAQKFGNCGVGFSPIAPATGEPPGADAPAGAFNFPLAGGTLNARTGVGEIHFGGGYRLTKGEVVADVSDPHFLLQTATTGVLNGAASPLNGLRAPLGDIVSGTFMKTLTADGGTVSFSQVDIRISSVGEGFLSQVYGCTDTKAGDPFAVASGTGQVN